MIPRKSANVDATRRSRASEFSQPGRLPLTPIERAALDRIERIISEGRQATQAEITDAIGSQNVAGSTAVGVMNRLEAKGYIKRQVFQRGMTICLADTGQCSIPPRDTSPHWRLRTERVPAPAIQTVREKSKPLSAMIEAEARLSGKHLTDFLADLVYIGWHAMQAEKEG